MKEFSTYTGAGKWFTFSLWLILGLFLTCKINDAEAQGVIPSDELTERFTEIQTIAEKKMARTLQQISYDPTRYPDRTDPETGHWVTRNHYEWTSGFFPGMLWQLYELTGKRKWRDNAVLWTANLEPQKFNNHDHDAGFRMMPSFGLGYELTGNPDWPVILRQAANSLAMRYNPDIGAIKSWEAWTALNANYPVIIDNMINLELLFWAAGHGGKAEWQEIAVEHAKTTLKHHIRPDGTTYHIVDFDENGNVNRKFTTQGYGPDSVWARGQAWAVYGFTMAYRFTKEYAFLEAAKDAADYFIENLPPDHIPWFDFRAPHSPWRTKDTSAAAIAASALIELYEFTNDQRYLTWAETLLMALSSEPYFSRGNEISSLLTKGTRHQGDPEIGLIYADYYLLEAWIRYSRLSKQLFPKLDGTHHLYLHQNFPNPFSQQTTIPYGIERDGDVLIQLFDMSGRLVDTLVDRYKASGSYYLQINTTHLTSGVYICRMTAGKQVHHRKIVFIK